MRRILNLFLLILTIAVTIHVHAQSTTGTILGRVTDPSGAAIPGAKVTITNVQTSETHSIQTNGQGEYVVPQLPIGEYRVESESDGFKRTARTGITLTVNEPARIDIVLTLGSSTQQVEVNSDATQVNTYTPELGQLLTPKTINDLPLNGRNVYDLLVSLPGVSSINAEVVPSRDNNTFVANGGRATSNSCFIDGGFNNDIWRNQCSTPPNPDAIQEIQLLSSNGDVEYGRLPGAFMNTITKSGTNQFHGSAYEYFRNDALNAKQDFLTSVAPLKQNQFGASLGGPILKNKILAFGSWEQLKIRQSQYVYSIGVPTAAEEQGNFSSASDSALFTPSWLASPTAPTPVTSASSTATLAPITNFSRTKLPINPVALAIAKSMPLGNNPDGTLTTGVAAPDNVWQYLIRGDYLQTAKQKWSASWFQLHSSQVNPFPCCNDVPGFGQRVDGAYQHNLVVNYTWTPTNNVINEARFNLFNRDTPWNIIDGETLDAYGMNFKQGAIADGDDPKASGPRIQSISGRLSAGSWDATGHDRTLGGSDTVIWLKGRHNIKLGTFVMWGHYAENGTSTGGGQIADSGQLSGNPMADFLMGYMSNFTQDSGDHPDENAKYWHSFAQDTWRISPRFTLTAGLRYEITTPLVWTVNYISQFKEGVQSTVYPSAPPGILYYGDPGVSRAGRSDPLNNFAPRLGIAIDPFGNGKTSIRAGYGIYYMSSYGDGIRAPQPFVLTASISPAISMTNPWLSYSANTNPFPYLPPKAGSANVPFTLPMQGVVFATPGANVDGNPIKPATRPWVNQLNFSVQQQLTPAMSLQMAYVGTISRKLTGDVDQNNPIYETDPITGAPPSASNFNDRRPYLPGSFQSIGTYVTGYNASYNALQIVLLQHLAHGLTFNANYTWAKSIDLISGDTLNGGLAFTSSLNPGLDKGPTSSLPTQIFAFSGTYQTPKVRQFGRVGDAVLSDWAANSIVSIHNGSPINVTSDVDSNMDGVVNDRPNQIGNPTLSGGRSRSEKIAEWFNPAAFVAAPAGTYGNVGRDSLTGPGFANADISFFRNFPIREQQNIEFRAEMFDAFNHGNLENPTSDLKSTVVGRITSVYAARVVQFGLHFAF